MQTDKIISLLNNPLTITKKQTAFLQEVLEEFPYFQAARVIHLKGLKKQNSFLYNGALKKTACFTTNRTVLFDFITKEILNDVDEQNLHQINVIDSKVIKKGEKVSIHKVAKEKEVEKILEVGKPISFNKSDAFSFNQWLQLSDSNQSKSIKQKENEDENTQNNGKNVKNTKKTGSNKLHLIEKFLEKKPKIKPVKKTAILDVSKDSVKPNTSLMTETLARVYIEQKKYDKAIQAFRILSLKYPEKSSFFANQIKAVEFLKNN